MADVNPPIRIDEPADLAKVLLAARVAADLTQYEAAALSKVGQPDISMYENGHRTPGVIRTLALLRAYGWRLEAVQEKRL